MSDMQVSEAAITHASRAVCQIVRTAYPDAKGERETLLLIAVATAQYEKHAAVLDRGFGAADESALAYLMVAANHAKSFREDTDALIAAAVRTRTFD